MENVSASFSPQLGAVYQLFSALSIPLLASLEIHRELTIQAAEMGISLNHLISATRSQQEAGKKITTDLSVPS